VLLTRVNSVAKIKSVVNTLYKVYNISYGHSAACQHSGRCNGLPFISKLGSTSLKRPANLYRMTSTARMRLFWIESWKGMPIPGICNSEITPWQGLTTARVYHFQG
jgi:hypothetical protein